MRAPPCMGELLEFQKRGQFSDLGDFIFNPVQKSTIVVVAEGSFIPMEPRGEAIELDIVFGDTVQVLHAKMVNLHFCIPSQVERAKICFKFPKEQVPILKPIFLCRFSEYSWLEPLEGHTFEEGDGKVDSVGVLWEILWVVPEI